VLNDVNDGFCEIVMSHDSPYGVFGSY
jgi:hypothetical protein